MTVLGDKRRRSSKELFDASVLTGTYSDTEWRKIETSLAGAGVDLDETMVDLELSDVGQALERPLRDALQGLACYYGAISRLSRPLTPKQQAAGLRKGLTTLKTALDAIYGADTPAVHRLLNICDQTRSLSEGSPRAALRRLHGG